MKLVSLFKQCAYAPTLQMFQTSLEELRKEGKEKLDSFLEDIPYEHWANAHFSGLRYGDMCSNIAESFNSWILEERSLPITLLVDGIRKKMMKMIDKCYTESEKWTSVLCPEMEKLLSENAELCRHWTVSRSSSSILEVHNESRYVVNLETWECSCEMWRINGFPCPHAVAAIQRNGENVYDYIECFFKVQVFRDCYSEPIHPVPDAERLVFHSLRDAIILPPIVKKQPGRPRKKRIKSVGEEKSQKKCRICGFVAGHNKKKCVGISKKD